ncbi:MAG: YbaN family protein [Pyrinomonadaceae bacterium]
MDVRKAVLIFLGTVCVGLGLLGMFLPLMPTTVFLLMAAYCYSKSSEKFHNWLMTNRLFGKYISDYKSGKGISVRQKITTIAVLWASIGFSIWFVAGSFWPTLCLAGVVIGVTLHLVLLRTYNPERDLSVEQIDADQIENI